MLSQNAVEYTVERILTIAGLARDRYEISGASAAVGGKRVIFTLLNASDQRMVLSGEYKMAMIESADGHIRIPAAISEDAEFADMDNDILTVRADIITLPFALLTRYEETLTSARDRYGRFSYQDSLVRKYGIIYVPVVDEYALLLRKYLTAFLPGEHLIRREPRIIPTHDVDTVQRFRGFIPSIRSVIGGDLIRNLDIRGSLTSMKQFGSCLGKPEKDPYYFGCNKLCRLSKQMGLISEFYFMGNDTDDLHSLYDSNSETIVIQMQVLEREGMEIGLHGGWNTHDSAENFIRQKTRIERALGHTICRGRQHYLCFNAMITPMIWESAGMAYDSTLGFFDHEGFMCGTSYPYPLYDLTTDRILKVFERPLLFMDVTLKGYRRLTIDAAMGAAMTMLDRVAAAGGDFVILWHNSSLEGGWRSWYVNFYTALLQSGRPTLK